MLTGATDPVVLVTASAVGIVGGLLRHLARRLDRDAATRRDLEGELRRSCRYVALSRDLVCSAGFDGFFMKLSAAWTETLGWSEAELRSRPFVEFVHPDDRELTEHESARLTQGAITVDFVNRCATKDGGWRWIEWQATAVMDEGLIYASARDITCRKAAQDGLRAREGQTRQILEAAHDAFISMDAGGLITGWNAQAEATFGRARHDVLGRELAATIIPEGHRAKHRRGLERLLATGEPRVAGKRLELTALHRDGHEFPIELTISFLETEDGYSFNAFVRDISARMRSKELLERQRRQLVEAQSVGGFGSWEWEIAAGTIEWSAELCRIYGVQSGGQRSFEEFLALVHPGDRDRMRATVQTAYETRQPYSLEHRILRSDGAVRVLRGRGEVVADDAGRPVRMLGTSQDVTDGRAAEETRARAALVEYSEDAIIAKTLDGVIESWNRGAEQLFGYSS